MIDAKELRIGNWVFKSGEVYRILPVDFIYLYGEEDVEFLEGYKPIPLTPELLIGCGFSDWGDSFHLEGAVDYWKLTWDDKYTEWDVYFAPMKQHSGLEIASIEYLHQLQNLYYALNQKELEINHLQTKL